MIRFTWLTPTRNFPNFPSHRVRNSCQLKCQSLTIHYNRPALIDFDWFDFYCKWPKPWPWHVEHAVSVLYNWEVFFYELTGPNHLRVYRTDLHPSRMTIEHVTCIDRLLTVGSRSVNTKCRTFETLNREPWKKWISLPTKPGQILVMLGCFETLNTQDIGWYFGWVK